MTPAATIPTVTLNDDNTIPVLGVGVAELSAAEAEAAVTAALAAGYRLIDTAAVDGNEEAVGRAVANSGIPAKSCSSPPSSAPPNRVSSHPRTPAGPASSVSGWTTSTCT